MAYLIVVQTPESEFPMSNRKTNKAIFRKLMSPFVSIKFKKRNYFLLHILHILHILVVHFVLIPKWQEKLDDKKQKSVFLPLKVPKMTNIPTDQPPKTGNELAEEAGRMTSQIAQNICLFGLCQVFER